MKTHWFPLRRPAIKPLFLAGGSPSGGVGGPAVRIDVWNVLGVPSIDPHEV